MELMIKDPQKMLGFMAGQLINDGGLSVRGVFPPSDMSGTIPTEDAKLYQVTDDAMELHDAFNENRRYTNLQVRFDEFRQRLDHLKATKWTS